ncbi:MAG: GNAT family N-acetyltransferase [Kiritimatiellae bacterium]|nr:GNAT family N-acetyltransferase [Kiritimatiellia bacterium]
MINIRPIESGDLDDVRDLIDGIMNGEFKKESSAYHYQDLNDPLKHYGGKREIFLVAEKDGKIVGTVAIKEDGTDVALLRRIFVDSECRGKGFGEALLKKAMEFCFDHDYKNVSFRGTDKMQTALKLCLRNGFKEEDIAEIDDFKLLILSRELKK